MSCPNMTEGKLYASEARRVRQLEDLYISILKGCRICTAETNKWLIWIAFEMRHTQEVLRTQDRA